MFARVLLLAVAFAMHGASASAQPSSVAEAAPVAAAPSVPVVVHATADKAEVTVGEVFTIEVMAVGPAGTTYTFPAEASTESFELRSAALASLGAPEGRRDDAAGPPALAEAGTHRYQAMVFGLGEVEIPPVPVRYRLPDGREGEASSLPLELKVGTLLPKDPDEQKLADVRDPVSASIGRAFWIASAAALALLAALAYALLRWRRRKRAVVAPAVPELPPAAEALGALDALAARELPERGEFRVFYIELTVVAKRYLERRLEAPVVEMTSAEALGFLRGHAHGGELLPIVRELVEAADRVKFANGDGLAAEAGRHLASVRRLVGALEQRLLPSAGEAEGKAA